MSVDENDGFLNFLFAFFFSIHCFLFQKSDLSCDFRSRKTQRMANEHHWLEIRSVYGRALCANM